MKSENIENSMVSDFFCLFFLFSYLGKERTFWEKIVIFCKSFIKSESIFEMEQFAKKGIKTVGRKNGTGEG